MVKLNSSRGLYGRKLPNSEALNDLSDMPFVPSNQFHFKLLCKAPFPTLRNVAVL